jgi:thioester reductase-like protein
MNAHYLITGGAGSLGREIAARILRSEPGAKLAILVRARDEGEAEGKWAELVRFLIHYGHAANLCRVVPVVGDVGRPTLGLRRSVAEGLRRRTTHVIHAAASISLRMSLDAARATNVVGTREALTFAESCPRLERFVHLSTAYVAGDRTGRIREDQGYLGQRFLNTYEQSKCEAETLLLDGAPRLPVTIARPSIIVGNSGDGRTCNFGTLYHPLRLIAE